MKLFILIVYNHTTKALLDADNHGSKLFLSLS